MERAYSAAGGRSREYVTAASTVAAVSSALVFVLTLLVGFTTGVLSGMFGIGGAVVSTPAIRVLGATTLQAVGSTLPSILPSSISGSARYQRERLINVRVFAITSAYGVPASVAGSRLSSAVPGDGHLLMLATAALVGFTAYRTAFPTARSVERGEQPMQSDWWRFAVIGVAAGGLSGLLGVGGGILMVPLFSTWIGLPLKQTIGTSLACVGVFAIPGTLTHWYLGHIDWTFAAGLAIGAVFGAQLGARLTINASDRTLRISVGTMLGLIAAIYAAGEIIAWAG
jgi:hypothetical protein